MNFLTKQLMKEKTVTYKKITILLIFTLTISEWLVFDLTTEIQVSISATSLRFSLLGASNCYTTIIEYTW